MYVFSYVCMLVMYVCLYVRMTDRTVEALVQGSTSFIIANKTARHLSHLCVQKLSF